MQTMLSRVAPVKSFRPRRILLYGVPGIGKSTFASNAPGAVFVRTEDGDIECSAFPVATCLADVLQSLEELICGEHEFRTIVVDHLSGVEQLIWKAVCDDTGKDNIEGIPYGKGYALAVDKWMLVLATLDRCVDAGLAVILIAHSSIERFNNPEGDAYDHYAPRLHKLASAKVVEWCSEVFFANYKVFTKTETNGFNRKTTKAIGDGERIMRTSARPYCVAKNRLPGMPEEIEFSWDSFASHLVSIKGQ